MGLLPEKRRDIKKKKAESGSGHGRNLNQQPDQQKKRDDSDMVMEQWKDIPLE